MDVRAERIARYAMESEVRTLHRDSVIADQALVPGGARRAVFNVRDAPYDVHAEVEMPPAPDTARLSVRVQLDPSRVAVRVLCSPPDTNGIRAASIAAEVPPWATSPALSRRGSGVGHLGFTPLVTR